MKIPFILLIVCVVVTFALPEPTGDEENLNEISDDEETVKSTSSNEPTESRTSWVRRKNRRHWLKQGDVVEWPSGNCSDSNDKELTTIFSDTNESDEKQDNLMTDGDSENEKTHYRQGRRGHHGHHGHHGYHGHRRLHHHHRTTTTTTTTTTLSTPLSDWKKF